MPEFKQYEARALILPQQLVLDTIAHATIRPQNSFEADIASRRMVSLAQSIRHFTGTAINACRDGERILLPRDFITEDVVDPIKMSGGRNLLVEVGSALTNIRTNVGEALRERGADVLVEDGILTPNDFRGSSPRYLLPESAWTRLNGSDRAAKLTQTGSAVMTGPRPAHRFLHDEVVYALNGADQSLGHRFQALHPGHRKFYATTAKYEPDKKNMLDALSDGITLDLLEKYMLDMMNAMEAISFLHDKGMVHRDIKPENIFDGGMVFDNMSVIQAVKTIGERFHFGTFQYIPEQYAVNWTSATPYFNDIFAFALSMAEAISLEDGETEVSKFMDFYGKYNRDMRKNMHPEFFVKHLKFNLFSDVDNKKLLAAGDIVGKMILGEGKYTLADALRDLSAIFGARV